MERKEAQMASTVQSAAGEIDMNTLWQNNRGLLQLCAGRWYNQHPELCAKYGITLDDLQQETFFALKTAVETYEPDRAAFSTHLCQCCKYRFAGMIRGEHVRLVTGRDGKARQVSADAWRTLAYSLDEPLTDDDDSEDTRMDVIADPSAAAELDAAADSVFNDELHAALDEAMQKLSERERDIIDRVYYQNEPQKAIAAQLGSTAGSVNHSRTNALLKLARDKRLAAFRDDILSSSSWHGTGLTAFREQQSSVEERTIEKLDNMGAYRREQCLQGKSAKIALHAK